MYPRTLNCQTGLIIAFQMKNLDVKQFMKSFSPQFQLGKPANIQEFPLLAPI